MHVPDPSERRLGATSFVERQTYRRRRMVDAARVLPVLGLLLWLIPILWTAGDAPVPMSRALLYVFGVWLGLSVVAALLIRGIRRNSAPDRPEIELRAADPVAHASGVRSRGEETAP